LKALFFCACLVGTNAFGATADYVCTIPSGGVSFTYGCTEPLFDLGPAYTLTSVTLTLSSSAIVDMGILNTDSVAHTYSLSALVPLTITGPGPYSVAATASVGPESGTLAPGTFDSFTGLTGSAGPVVVAILPQDFSLFTGSGSQTFAFVAQGGPIDLNATSDATGSFQIWFTDAATEAGAFTLEYDYTTANIPEPATLFTMGGALAGLGFLARRVFRQR
jgi:hypothetical protein